MRFGANYLWVSDWWRDGVPARQDRRWIIAALVNGDLALRDGFAYGCFLRQLEGRKDIDYRHIHAWTVGGPTARSLEPGQDVLLIGRPRPFFGSFLATCASRLEGGMAGRFVDLADGRAGDSIRYGNRIFSRHVFEESPTAPYRRCDVDYAVLVHRRETINGEDRDLWCCGGIGLLGTLCNAVLLFDAVRRRRLVTQIRELAPWHPRHCPEDHFEACIRIDVRGGERLSGFLDAVTRGDRHAFDFRVDAVALGTEDGGKDVYLREKNDPDLEIECAESGHGGRVRRCNGGTWIRVSPSRFELLRLLAEDPNNGKRQALLRHFNILGPKEDREATAQEKNRLAKLAFDLSKFLSDDRLLGSKGNRSVRLDKKADCYTLGTLRVLVREG